VNDDWTSAQIIGPAGEVVSGGGQTATFDQPAWDEDPAAGGKWVWYSYTPDFSGDVDLDFYKADGQRHVVYEADGESFIRRGMESTRNATYAVEEGHQYLIGIQYNWVINFGLMPVGGADGAPRLPAHKDASA
jgi:hypothetical protein